MRRAVVLGLMALAPLLACLPAAQAATPAETFVSDNINKGLAILNDKQLSTEQRRSEFEQFLLGLTDMRPTALYALGKYRRGASDADINSFAQAFQTYAVAVYHSYFNKYAGQTLKITGSTNNHPGDDIVHTTLIDPDDKSGQPPLKVDFRVKTNSGKPLVVDLCVENIWLSEAERSQFTSVLDNNGGNIPALVTRVKKQTTQMVGGSVPGH